MEQPAEVQSQGAPDGRFRTVQAWGIVAVIVAVVVFGVVYMAVGQAAPICIALANSLTGASAPAGSESLEAIELAVDEANGTGGVNVCFGVQIWL